MFVHPLSAKRATLAHIYLPQRSNWSNVSFIARGNTKANEISGNSVYSAHPSGTNNEPVITKDFGATSYFLFPATGGPNDTGYTDTTETNAPSGRELRFTKSIYTLSSAPLSIQFDWWSNRVTPDAPTSSNGGTRCIFTLGMSSSFTSGLFVGLTLNSDYVSSARFQYSEATNGTKFIYQGLNDNIIASRWYRTRIMFYNNGGNRLRIWNQDVTMDQSLYGSLRVDTAINMPITLGSDGICLGNWWNGSSGGTPRGFTGRIRNVFMGLDTWFPTT